MAIIAEAVRYHRTGDTARAELICRQILDANPEQTDALHLMGIIAYQRGWHDLALEHLRRAVDIDARQAQLHNSLGIVWRAKGCLEEAKACYQKALILQPDYAEALNNLGNVWHDQNRLAEAKPCFQRALALRPDYPEALNSLGNVWREEGRLDEALDCCRRALALHPRVADGHNNLGNIYHAQHRLEEAACCYQRALDLQPNHASAHYNLGNAWQELDKLELAEASYRQALRYKPDHAKAHCNLGTVHLLRGEFELGWQEYEWRFRCPDFATRSFQQPAWDGTALHGRTILLYAEQGIGDTLQFARYAPLVKERVGIVLLECQAELVPVLEGWAGVDHVFAQGAELPQFDNQAALLSLPRLLQTRLATVPAPLPRFAANGERIEHWRRELADLSGFKVGICWQGNPSHRRDWQRSVALKQFAPLARVRGVRLLSMQKGAGAEQLGTHGTDLKIVDLGNRLASWADTAAVLTQLDLLVSVDTAVVHLAGALGRPAWVALPNAPDWRWLLGREDSPWYPSLRLFRLEHPGGWEPVFKRMANTLEQRLR
jgi:tetratricopeptide (TPR) repeat protein